LNVIEQRYGEKYRQGNCDGRSKWVDINTFDSITNCLDTLKVKGIKSATTPHENDCLLEDFDISKPSALFLEQRETDYRRNFATRRWFSKNPDGGFTESLNISVSAAIIIQNLTNRLAIQIDWHLSETEILESVWLGPKN
jgi:tRNA (guanosine-2'-O-)-methyltransferase